VITVPVRPAGTAASPLGRASPLATLAVAAAWLAALATTLDPRPAILVALAAICASLALGRVAPRDLARGLAPLWLAALSVGAFNALLAPANADPATAALTAGPLRIAGPALEAGVALALRVAAIVAVGVGWGRITDATHLTDGDIALLGRSQTTACICPSTEQDLADGIGPARRLADAGSPIALGTDQHVMIDMLAEARTLEMHERLSSGRRGRFSVEQLVEALAPSGHAALGWPEAGRIEVGSLCDLVGVRLDSIRTAGSLPGQVPMVASAGDVDVVVVGGRLVPPGAGPAGGGRSLPRDDRLRAGPGEPREPPRGTSGAGRAVRGEGVQAEGRRGAGAGVRGRHRRGDQGDGEGRPASAPRLA